MAVHALWPYIFWIIAGFTLAIWALAWTKGGPAERIGATMVIVAWAIVIALQRFVTHGPPSLALVSLPLLLTDFLLSVGLLVLAIRYASLWVGGAMLAQSAQLAIYALFIADGGSRHQIYEIASNISSVVLLASLLAGTLSSWRKRSAR